MVDPQCHGAVHDGLEVGLALGRHVRHAEPLRGPPRLLHPHATARDDRHLQLRAPESVDGIGSRRVDSVSWTCVYVCVDTFEIETSKSNQEGTHRRVGHLKGWSCSGPRASPSLGDEDCGILLVAVVGAGHVLLLVLLLVLAIMAAAVRRWRRRRSSSRRTGRDRRHVGGAIAAAC